MLPSRILLNKKRKLSYSFIYVFMFHIILILLIYIGTYQQLSEFSLNSKLSNSSTISFESTELKYFPIQINSDDIIELIKEKKSDPDTSIQEKTINKFSENLSDITQDSSTSASSSFHDEYLAHITKLLNQHKYYPETERRRGREGVVTLSFTIFSNGAVNNVEIINASTYSLLNQAAIDTVHRAAPYPHLEEGVKELLLSVSIEFLLGES